MFEKYSPISLLSSLEGTKIFCSSKSVLLKLPIAPFPPDVKMHINFEYHVELIVALINAGSSDEAISMNPPGTDDFSCMP